MKTSSVLMALMLLTPFYANACEIPSEVENVGQILESINCLDKKIESIKNVKRSGGNSLSMEVLQKEFEFTSDSKTESNGISFYVSGCIKKDRLVCNLRVVSRDKDIRFELNRSSRIFDENGYESRLESAVVGGVKSSYSNDHEVHKTLISNIPTPVQLKFPIPDGSSTAISAIYLVYEINNGSDLTTDIRNILIKES